MSLNKWCTGNCCPWYLTKAPRHSDVRGSGGIAPPEKSLFTTKQLLLVRFQILTAASMKMAVCWIVALCRLIEVCLRFRGACCLRYRHGNGSSKHL
jgi:hypothetical protein